MKHRFFLVISLLLTACQPAPAGFTPEPLRFVGGAMRVNVAKISITETYQSPGRRPNVEQEFPQPPADAVKQWARERLSATGASGTLEITIDDASVKEVPLPKKKGVEGLFTDDQDARYDARIHVTMRLYNGTDALAVANGDVLVTRSRSLNEKATIAAREAMFDSMTKQMIVTFDQTATARLRQYFSAYVN